MSEIPGGAPSEATARLASEAARELPRRGRRWRDAGAGILLLLASSVFVLVATEVAFRIRGTGEPQQWYLPAQGGAAAGQIETIRYETTPRMPLRIAPARFAARKAPDALRVFLLGDSTVYGYPYGPKGTPSRVLEILLSQSLPGRRIEVINAGFLGADSSRALALLAEILAFEPDAVVVYVGHNEFLRYDEAHQADVHFGFNPRVRLAPSAAAFVALHESALWRWACGTNLGLSARGWWLARRTGQTLGRSGLVEGALREATFRSHRENLVDMARLCRERKVALVLCTLAGNARSQPPLLRRHGRVGAERLAAARRHIAAAEGALSSARARDALEESRAALTADSADAWADWLAARALVAAGRTGEAAAAFEDALEKDGLRHRAFARVSETIREVARQEKVPLADIRDLFERNSPEGIVGEELIVDHVHPNLSGMVLLARGIAGGLQQAGVLAPWTGGAVPGASLTDTEGGAVPGASLTDTEVVARLGLDRAAQRDAMLRLGLSAAGQGNPRRAASLFHIAATLYDPDDPEGSLGPPFCRGVAALLQDDLPRARELLGEVRRRDPAWYARMTGRFAQLRIAERVGN